MEQHILDSVFTFVTVIVAIVAVVTMTWLSRRQKHQLPTNDLLKRLDGISSRLSQLDSSIDTIAIEVERISEAQRFTAKILAERTSAAPLPPAAETHRQPGYTTPH